MEALARMLLTPGELVVRSAHIEGDDHQVTVRMLVNSLFWGAVIGIAVLIALT
ncbi:MAG TPA: hypothetical protein VHD15_18700 [Hyphomicrobiales bacterium]|nr:hypothetical protein [Hyphomicrobiales bacterium]